MQKAVVCSTKDITPESLVKIYETPGRKLHGKVTVKIPTGGSGAQLPTALPDQALVKKPDSTKRTLCGNGKIHIQKKGLTP